MPPRCLAELVDGVLLQRRRVPLIRGENPPAFLLKKKKKNLIISPFFCLRDDETSEEREKQDFDLRCDEISDL